MTRDEIQRALVLLGHQSKYWGPDQSTYAAFAAGWPAANGPCPTEAELQSAWDADAPARAAAAAALKVSAIRDEAEKRIAAGITVNSKQFRADEASIARMGRLADALAAAAPGTTQTFKTAAGDTFTVDSSQAAAIFAAQVNWQGAILAASAVLQADPPADPTAPENWPTKPSITV